MCSIPFRALRPHFPIAPHLSRRVAVAAEACAIFIYDSLIKCFSKLSGCPFDFIFFFFKDTATPEIYPLPLHDPLPILPAPTPSWPPSPAAPARSTSPPASPPRTPAHPDQRPTTSSPALTAPTARRSRSPSRTPSTPEIGRAHV